MWHTRFTAHISVTARQLIKLKFQRVSHSGGFNSRCCWFIRTRSHSLADIALPRRALAPAAASGTSLRRCTASAALDLRRHICSPMRRNSAGQAPPTVATAPAEPSRCRRAMSERTRRRAEVFARWRHPADWEHDDHDSYKRQAYQQQPQTERCPPAALCRQPWQQQRQFASGLAMQASTYMHCSMLATRMKHAGVSSHHKV